jgi:type I restriction enzyme M protein
MEDVKENNLITVPQRTKKLSEVTTSYTYFKTDDILLAKVTPCFENGKCTIPKKLINGIGFGSSEFIVLRCNEKVKKEWVYCFLVSNNFKQLGIESFTGTSGLRRVSKDFVAKYKIPLPPINIQEKYIENIYSEIDFVNKNVEMIKKFEEKISNKVSLIWSN